jgi:hypothetical protein
MESWMRSTYRGLARRLIVGSGSSAIPGLAAAPELTEELRKYHNK